MIGIALMAGTLMLAQYDYGSPPPSSSHESKDELGLDTKPFVQLQRRCFDKAVAEVGQSAVDARQQRFDTCVALHDAMVKHATAKLGEREAAEVKRELDRALQSVEKSYARKLGVAMPDGSR